MKFSSSSKAYPSAIIFTMYLIIMKHIKFGWVFIKDLNLMEKEFFFSNKKLYGFEFIIN